MTWPETLARLTAAGERVVVVTVAAVRGHAPRGPGAKMLVTAWGVHGSVGGGNLEMAAVERARAMLEAGARAPELATTTLTAKERGEWGAQCCGGEVTLLLEPVGGSRPQVAIFGAGHVGLALARVLLALPVDLLLVDSRPKMLEPSRLAELGSGPARLETRVLPLPGFPEQVLDGLRSGAHLVVLTHDHAQDYEVLAAALARPDLGFVGLIGSATKWARFRARLAGAGFSATDLERVTTPIGVPGVRGKVPAAIAISTAAQLLARLELPESEG